jgi:hypothetical protein
LTVGAAPLRILLAPGLAVAIAALTLLSAVATAAPVDSASTHIALRALDRYVKASQASLPASRRSAQEFVVAIAGRCPNALAPLASLPASFANSPSAKAFIDETVADLVAKTNAPLGGAVARLGATLRGLRWSSPRAAAIVAVFPRATHALVAIGTSDLCADARAFAAHPHSTPAGTRRWLAKFRAVNTRATNAAHVFGLVLGAFRAPKDAGVLRDIARRANQLLAADKALTLAEEKNLLGALGLHG